MRRVAALALLLTACSAAPTSQAPTAPPDTVYAYSLVAPREASPSGLVARAVLPSGTTCPDLELTGTPSVRMAQRTPGITTKDAFSDVLVCSAPIPSGATGATVAGRTIPATLPAQVSSLAAIADTGCLIRYAVQDCLSQWPFAQLSQQIAGARPDLIVHAGDFFYRQRACPANAQQKCAGSPVPPKGVPFQDSGAGWLADFFEPAAPMLASAPLLTVRGNHENCAEAGNGYFLFMDPGQGSADRCAPTADGKAPVVLLRPWRIDLPLATGKTVRLVAADAAHGWTYGISEWSQKLRPMYRQAMGLAKDADGPVWMVVHEPPLALTTTRYRPKNVPDWTNWVGVDQAVASRGLLTRYDALVSGHVHVSQVVKIPGLPPQFVVGGGGTLLDPPKGYRIPKYGPLADAQGQPLVPGFRPYPREEYIWTGVTHAFALAQPGQADWTVRYVTADGSDLTSCSVGDDVSCG